MKFLSLILITFLSLAASAKGVAKVKVLGLTEAHFHHDPEESLEYTFLKLLKGPCGITPFQAATSLSTQNEIVLSKTSLLEQFEKNCSREKVSAYFKKYKAKVLEVGQKTHDKMLDRIRKKSLWYEMIPEVSEAISVIGAVESKGGRIDAFALWALKAYETNPTAFEQELNKTLDPRTSLFYKAFTGASRLSELETSVLSLVTHNHLAEQALLIKVYATHGAYAAWKLLQKLDALYEMERKFWAPFELLCFEDLLKTYPDSVPQSLNYCAAYLSNQELVPLRKSYHFWGSLIAVRRLSQELMTVKLFPKAIFLKLGSFYKESTSSTKHETEITLKVYKASRSAWR